MKRVLVSILFVIMTICAMAQNSISLYLCSVEQKNDVPTSSLNYLLDNLRVAISTDGLAAQNDYITQFLLLPQINVITKDIIYNTQQQFVLNLDLSLSVVDNISGTIFAAKTISLKGVGTNETKAFNAAFRTLSKNHTQVKELVAIAKQKILDYYEAEAENIIKRANLLSAQRKYDEAFYLLSMVPSQCSKFDVSLAAGLTLWEQYKDYSCNKNLAMAQSVWVAKQDIDAANMAAAYLSTILPDADCYGDAQELYEEIKLKVGKLWNYEMKVYNDEMSLRNAKVKAIQEIGVAYGKGQQPNFVINKLKY